VEMARKGDDAQELEEKKKKTKKKQEDATDLVKDVHENDRLSLKNVMPFVLVFLVLVVIKVALLPSFDFEDKIRDPAQGRADRRSRNRLDKLKEKFDKAELKTLHQDSGEEESEMVKEGERERQMEDENLDNVKAESEGERTKLNRRERRKNRNMLAEEFYYKKNDCVNECLEKGICQRGCPILHTVHARAWAERSCRADGVSSEPICFVSRSCGKWGFGVCDMQRAIGPLCSTPSFVESISEKDRIAGEVCNDYLAACQRDDGPTLPSCGTGMAPLGGLPSREVATKAVLSICQKVDSPACSSCTSLESCAQPFDKLVSQCFERQFKECEVLDGFCKSIERFGLEMEAVYVREVFGCPALELVPSPKNYLYFSPHFYLWFREWVTETDLQFWAALFFIVLLAAFSVRLKAYRHGMERDYKSNPLYFSRDDANAGQGFFGSLFLFSILISDDGTETVQLSPKDTLLGRNMARFGQSVLINTVDFALLLLVTTMNKLVIAAVIIGYGLGQMLFGHLLNDDIVLEDQDERKKRD